MLDALIPDETLMSEIKDKMYFSETKHFHLNGVRKEKLHFSSTCWTRSPIFMSWISDEEL